jgi:FkbM family methyltransferase
LIASFLNKLFSPKIECALKKEHFGSQYGGWDVATDYISLDSIIYSFGIGTDASFDSKLINRYKVVVHAFDPTPKSIYWVKKQDFSDNFVFHEYGLADLDGTVQFNPPVNPDHVSYTIIDRLETKENAISVPVKKLKTIMNELGHNKVDILKMDIEGAEYQVIEDMIASKIYPTQILVEFHHRFLNVGLQKTKNSINLLKRAGYCLFSVSDSKEEFCFILKSEK